MAKKKTENTEIIEESKQDGLSEIETDEGAQNDNTIALTDNEKIVSVGDKVKVRKGACVYGTTTQFPHGFYAEEYFVKYRTEDGAVLSLKKETGLGGSVAGIVAIADLTLV